MAVCGVVPVAAVYSAGIVWRISAFTTFRGTTTAVME